MGRRWSACYAPHASMYFDQHGKVRACCQNTGTYLGDVRTASIADIWRSASANAMRSALEHDDFSEGCDFCAWQADEGHDEVLFARHFDHLRPRRKRPRWPRQMEFSLTNTCNLQCVMCNGDWSSTIRAQREKRDPLPAVYGERFYAELAPFLAHLEVARFLGGEPFLGEEPLRVMEMLTELDAPPVVNITTNASVWTARVDRIVEALRPEIVVSLDGADSATYDAIRVGAHFERVIANLDRFIERLGPGNVSLAVCLMRDNHLQFDRILGLAEERGIGVGVNVVRFPEEHSLYALPPDELAAALDEMEARRPALTGTRREMWDGHRAALTRHLARVRSEGEVPVSLSGTVPREPEPPPSRWPWIPFPEEPVSGAEPPPPYDGPETVVLLDLEGHAHLERRDLALRVAADDLDGHPVDRLIARLSEEYGDPDTWHQTRRAGNAGADVLRLHLGHDQEAVEVELLEVAVRAADGALLGNRLHFRPPGADRDRSPRAS